MRAAPAVLAAFKFCHKPAAGVGEANCLSAVAAAGFGTAVVKLLHSGFIEHSQAKDNKIFIVVTEFLDIGLFAGSAKLTSAGDTLTFCLRRLATLLKVCSVRARSRVWDCCVLLVCVCVCVRARACDCEC